MNVFRKVKVFSFFILIFSMFTGFFTNFVYAQDASSEKTLYLNDKQINNETLFNNEKLVNPGDKITKKFYIKNNNDFKSTIKSFTIDGELRDKAGNVFDKDLPQFNNFMSNSTISIYYKDKEISKQNLSDSITFNLSENNQISIDKNDTKEFIIEYALNRNSNNSIQGVEYVFNIGINYTSIDGSESNASDNGSGGVSLVQTGTFFDNKLLTTIGICFFVIGIILILSKDILNKKGN